VGRLDEIKGYPVAIEAFGRLAAEHPDLPLWLVLVGQGKERARLEQAARDTGLGDRILLRGFSDKPWEPLSALDVFLMPSQNEGLPLTLVEAMACGCLPVAMGVGGVPEVLTDPGLGWLVGPGDRAGFYAAMKEAVKLPEDARREMVRRGRQLVVTRFNAAEQFRSLAEVIESRNGKVNGGERGSDHSRAQRGAVLEPSR
jgi:glycosyltransferase involved in cell wall biosynthesis